MRIDPRDLRHKLGVLYARLDAQRPLFRRLQRTRADLFESVELPPGAVVMLGDSITEFGLFNELIPDLPVINRGISGETSADVLRRMHTAINAPRAVFVLIGTNDLGRGVPVSKVIGNLQLILAAIERLSPGARVFVQSVMPRQPEFAADIRSLNTGYRALTQGAGPQISYVDLWPTLADGDRLRAELSDDEVHLNGNGYAAWMIALQPALREIRQAR